MRKWQGCKGPAGDVSATSSSATARSPTSSLPQLVQPGPGYDEDAALQAALEASAQEYAAQRGQVPATAYRQQHPAFNDEERQLQQALQLSKQNGDAQLAFELQQQEVERARAAATSNRPSGGHSTDSFAAMTGLSPLAPSQPTPQQPPHRPTNNPFAPDRRMPWAVAPGASQPPGASSMGATSPQGAGASSASSQDPFALLPPLYAQPAAPAQPPVQPPTGRFPSVQYPAPARPPQQLPPQAAYQPSWQASFPEPWANGVNPNRAAQPPPQHTSASLAADEALARALQQQLDMEGNAPLQPDARDAALAKALQEQLDKEREQTTSNQRANGPSTFGTSTRSAPPPQHTGGDPGVCGGCGRPAAAGWGRQYITALGRSWHPECFCCGHCRRPMAESFVTEPDGRVPYHASCFRLKFGQRCCVCTEFIPEVPGKGIVYMTHDFWKDQKSCPAHQSDGTVRCTACQRLCPRKEQWAQLEQGRHICLACLDSVVVDTQDAQPLYSQVMAFFESMGMKLPVKPPLMLVDSAALGSAEAAEHRPTGGGSAGGGAAGGGLPMFHTRGLTLTQEYRQIRTVVRNRGRPAGGAGLPFFSVRPETTRIEGPAHTEVTAILVQFGLPWLLTGSILAHELMHAYLRLSGLTQLSMDVEEGLCQLMALLWLERQPPSPEGTWEERLMSYFAHQIRTDRSHVYGDGFRAAHEAFQKHGLGAVLASVRACGRLPLH